MILDCLSLMPFMLLLLNLFYPSFLSCCCCWICIAFRRKPECYKCLMEKDNGRDGWWIQQFNGKENWWYGGDHEAKMSLSPWSLYASISSPPPSPTGGEPSWNGRSGVGSMEFQKVGRGQAQWVQDREGVDGWTSLGGWRGRGRREEGVERRWARGQRPVMGACRSGQRYYGMGWRVVASTTVVVPYWGWWKNMRLGYVEDVRG